jgi:hypothetical protein
MRQAYSNGEEDRDKSFHIFKPDFSPQMTTGMPDIIEYKFLWRLIKGVFQQYLWRLRDFSYCRRHGFLCEKGALLWRELRCGEHFAATILLGLIDDAKPAAGQIHIGRRFIQRHGDKTAWQGAVHGLAGKEFYLPGRAARRRAGD